MAIVLQRKRKLRPSNDLNDDECKFAKRELKWVKYSAENLSVDFCVFYDKSKADYIYAKLEEECDWNTGKAAQVMIFGRWHNIPRKQVHVLAGKILWSKIM